MTAGGGGPETKRLAVLGHPVSQSRSPAMQSAALEALGLSGEWSYGAVDLDPAEFDERVRALPGEGYVGVNVTIPHKLRALELASRASDTARAVGAANTLRLGPEELFADNTDVAGFLAALRGQAPEAPTGRS
ncbi:MAG: hypothetical protein WA701_08725, partial [Solirubrobacterales bacterium]